MSKLTPKQIQELASKGRGGDTMLAHINSQEARMLQSMGGAGTINPQTGLREFYGMGQSQSLPKTDYPVLSQAFKAEEFEDIADKLKTTTVPAQGFGYGARPAYDSVSPEYAQYATRTPWAGMGTGGVINGYKIPTGKTYKGQPLIASYDVKGNFQYASIPEDQVLRPDPSKPNIISQPKFNKTGGIYDYGVWDTNNKGGGGFFDDLLGGITGALSDFDDFFTNPIVSTVSDTLADVDDAIVNPVVTTISDNLADLDDSVLQPALKMVNATVQNALDDPVATVIKIGTAVYAPYLLPFVNAADTLDKGGSIEDAIKVGAVTYVAQEGFRNLELGTETLPDGSSVPITPKSLLSDLGEWVKDNSTAVGKLGQDILSNAAVQGTLGAVKGGLMAAIKGGDIGDGITQGFTSGSVSGGLDVGFSTAIKDLGIDKIGKPDAMAIKAIMAVADGQDPNAILANYLAYTVNSEGAKLIAKTSKNAYDTFTTYATNLKTKSTNYENDYEAYDKARNKYLNQNTELQNEINEKWTPIQTQLDAINGELNTIKNEFSAQEAIYNDTSKSVTERNAAADRMESLANTYETKNTSYDNLYNANKDIYTDLVNRRDAITSAIATLDSTDGQKLATTRNELANDVATLADYKTQYENASDTYDKTIAEATTKNFLIDSINNGVITGERQEDGSILLSNGMSVVGGQFFQNGENVFSNGDRIEQGEIRFTDVDGKEVWFGNDRSEQVSTTDAQDMLFKDYGVKVDRDDVLSVAGQNVDGFDNDLIKEIAEDKVNEEFNSLVGRDATAEEMEAAFTPGQDTLQNIASELSAEMLPTDQFFSSEEDKIAYAKQLAAVRKDKGVGAEFTWYNPFTNDWETHQAFTSADFESPEGNGTVSIDGKAFTSQWQRVGDQRVFIYDDGTASTINPQTGETGYLTEDEVFELINQGLLNVPSLDEVVVKAKREEDYERDFDYPFDFFYDDPSLGEVVVRGKREDDDFSLDEVVVRGKREEDDEDSIDLSALQYTNVLDTTPRKAPIPGPGSPDRPTDPRGYMFTGVLPGTPGSGQPGVQPGPAQKGVLPTGNPLEQEYLNIGLSKDKFIDPLAQLYQIQQATAQGGDGNLAQLMFQQFNPTAPQATEPTEASGKGDSYYNYGEMDDTYTGAIDPFTPSPYTPSPYALGFEAARGGAIMANPLMAHGGKTLPLNVNGVLPTVSQGRENFKDGKHVAGEGDGQSDDIPAWLADGEFVFPADVVSALGNGSTKAGTDKLYDMMHSIREKARSTNPKDLPPPAKKSPLDYLRA